MAPEQFRGEVSHRSDQYSLGCIAYELVTGRQPFTAPDAITMGSKHMREPPIPPTRMNPGIPQEIEYVILKALEKRRINRYPDVLSFIEALRAPPVAQKHPSSIERASAITLVSKTKEQLLNEGTHLCQLGLYGEALEAYERALRLDSRFADAHFGKGNALYFLRRYEEALRAYEQAIFLAPLHAAFHNNKGGVLYILDRYKEALVAYEEALRLDSKRASSQCGRSMTLRRLGRSR